MSVWDAEHIYRRLQELARQDPLLHRHGSWRHGYELGPRLSPERVEKFERAYGIELPASYRSFLIQVGDGGAGPYFGMYRHDGSDWNYPRDPPHDHEPGFLATPFPHTERFGFDPEGEEDYDDPRFTWGSLTLAEFGCGAFYRLVVTGPARGRVWFDDLGSSELLVPGPDFRDWYQNWLDDPPPPNPIIPRLVRLDPGRYSHAPAADLALPVLQRPGDSRAKRLVRLLRDRRQR